MEMVLWLSLFDLYGDHSLEGKGRGFVLVLVGFFKELALWLGLL